MITTMAVANTSISSVQLISIAQLYLTLCDPMDCSMPGFPVHHQLLKFIHTHVHWVGDAIQPSHPLLSPSSPAFNLSQIRIFSDESVLLIRWPKYCSFSFSISPSSECSGVISFRMHGLNLLAIQFSSVQSLNHVRLCDLMNRSMPGLPVYHQLLESTQTHVHRVGDAIQLSHSLSPLLLLPSIFPSIRVSSNELAFCIRWSKYWSFSFSISPSNECSGLISFRIDWFDLLAI